MQDKGAGIGRFAVHLPGGSTISTSEGTHTTVAPGEKCEVLGRNFSGRIRTKE
jgi:hypothetical protein